MEKFNILSFKEIEELNHSNLKKFIINKLNFFTFPYFIYITNLRENIKLINYYIIGLKEPFVYKNINYLIN